MALYGVRVQILGRSDNRSAIAAASYRSGEALWDERREKTYFHKRTDVEHTEILLPGNAPAWALQADRETLWNQVERTERRKDAQLCRDIRVSIPREFDEESRIRVIKDFAKSSFVDLGMAADISWHLPSASDGGTNPHAHIMLTLRPFSETGFGKKSRHDMIPDPAAGKHPDGRTIMVSSNPQSWNDAGMYAKARERWQNIANDELQRIGSTARIDRRSYVERGIAKIAQPMLGVAYHAKRLHGVYKQRFNQWQACRLFAETERRANQAFAKLDRAAASPADRVKTANRFIAWFERQREKLAPEQGRGQDPSSQQSQGLER
jgi:ATP-dependent exoDNAse (exonuclease V) alpha subunit